MARALVDVRVLQREYLLAISRAMTAELDLGDLLRLILQSAVELVSGTAGIIALLVPSVIPLMGMFMLGNLMKESGVVGRLTDTAQGSLMNIVTILLGVSVGATMQADKFLSWKPLFIFSLGLVDFAVCTMGGVLTVKIMNYFLKEKINPIIGAAGVSAVPMAARVAQMEGLKADKTNHLLMHAVGPNLAGVIGSAAAAGMFIAMFD